ncbi:MAG: c-type cytochrome [Longimicrobiales bacterium]|nr:c-type cytochrome [Longimicrobiales bacterium]
MNTSRRILAVLLTAAASACVEPGPPATGEPGTGPSAPAGSLLARLNAEQAEGRVLFQSVCWTCHGLGGRGDGPALQSDTAGQPPDFIAEGYAELSVDALLDRFQASLTGDGTDPAHPHMKHVVTLLKPERFRAALSYIPVLAYPPGIPGSAVNGMALYETRCTGCHGERGDGAGYAADALITVKPADFRADTLIAAGDFEGLFRRVREGGRTVHGSSMPPWGTALSEAETWDLVAYVATFQEGALPPLPGGEG